MKYLSLMLTALFLTACASPTAVVVFCADVGPFNTVISSLPTVPPKVTADIALAKPIVDTICANPTTAAPADLTAFMTTGLPLILDIANLVPSTPEVKAVILDVDLVQAVLPGMIALAKANSAATTIP